MFPIYFQLCERSRTLLSNLASATGDFGVPVYPPGRCPLLTLGPETAVETFHLKGFGGFGLFITSLSQSLVFHSVRMRGIGNFCFPCAVLLCCSTCTTEATSVATLWDESGSFFLCSSLKLYQFPDPLLRVASCYQHNWWDTTFIFGGSIEGEGWIYPAGVSFSTRERHSQQLRTDHQGLISNFFLNKKKVL